MNKLIEKLNDSKELLAVIVAVATSLATIYQQTQETGKRIFCLGEQQWLLTVDILNLVVLAIALLLIKKKLLSLNADESEKLVPILAISKAQVRKNHIRVNALVVQLVTSLKLFFGILFLFYAMQLFVDSGASHNINSKIQERILQSQGSWIDVLRDSINNSNQSTNYLEVSRFLIIDFFINTFNLVSAAFLFVAFQVLYVPTLASDNRTNLINYFIPFSIAAFIILLNIIFVFIGVGNKETEIKLIVSTHMIRLAGGVYNGVAMSLLFSRFIAMEYFFKDAMAWKRHFYFVGTIVFLPLYVVAQPLYGIFLAGDIGGTEKFKAIVFLVCFWGKLVFILFMYTTLSKRWVHSYLLMVISNRETLREISLTLKGVKNFDE